MTRRLVLLAALLLAVASCGVKGDPLPPTDVTAS